jgi:hypothetical protein
MSHLPESDWRHFKSVHDAALERFSRRAIQECADILCDEGRSAHDRFLDLHYRVRERDRQIEVTFGEWRRSEAIRQLLAMYRLGLITDGELGGFTRDTRDAIEGLIDML